MTSWKSFFIGVLSSIIILMAAFMYFEGADYRQISKRTPLSTKETVGTLPDGRIVERYIIPYRGRFHYIYVAGNDTTMVSKTLNGRTTNFESNVFLNPRQK